MTDNTMTDSEAEVWDQFWDTDAARCCSCPSCNYYAPDYEQHKDEPCILRTLITRIVSHRIRSELLEIAREFEYEYALAWGGSATWISTGTHVADLVAGIVRERADEQITEHEVEL